MIQLKECVVAAVPGRRGKLCWANMDGFGRGELVEEVGRSSVDGWEAYDNERWGWY